MDGRGYKFSELRVARIFLAGVILATLVGMAMAPGSSGYPSTQIAPIALTSLAVGPRSSRAAKPNTAPTKYMLCMVARATEVDNHTSSVEELAKKIKDDCPRQRLIAEEYYAEELSDADKIKLHELLIRDRLTNAAAFIKLERSLSVK